MQKRYLTLLIATALFASACSKEKAPEHKVQHDEQKVERLSPDEQSQKIAELEAKLNAKQEQVVPVASSAPVLQQPAPAGNQAVQYENKQVCHATTDGEIAALFDRWNASLKTGKSDIVVSNYAADSILLPTVSNKVRHSAAEKADYFDHFLENAPVGEINERYIKIGCNTALDAGLYTFHYTKTGKSVTGRYSFTYEWNGDKWLITSHHSSVMPEQAQVAAEQSSHVQEPVAKEAVH
ncbi:cag pathogenicity island protein Cag5 [Neisseriaceae bacterium B1]